MSTFTQAAGAPYLPELDIEGPGRQRRLTVLLRLLLLIPQYIILYVLQIPLYLVVIIGWFAALALGRLPNWVAEFVSGYISYATRVMAYSLLLIDRYPPVAFNAPEYPARIYLQAGQLNRLAVLFRLILVIPAGIVATVLSYGWFICSFFLWLAVLIVGRTPRPVFDASAAVVRYYMRYYAYTLLLTDKYPKRLFGDSAQESHEPIAGGHDYPAQGAHPGQPVQEAPGSYPAQEGPGGYPAQEAPGSYPAQEAPGSYPPPLAYGPSQYPPSASGTRPLVLSSGGRTLLVAFIVLGVLGFLGQITLSALAPPQQADTQIQTTTM